MNPERGFPFPQDGNFWVPSATEKPVTQITNYPQPEMHQNQTGQERWNGLLGMYPSLLQESGPSHNIHGVVSPNLHQQGAFLPNVHQNGAPYPHWSGAVSPSLRKSGIFSPNLRENGINLSNSRNHNMQYANLNAGIIGSRIQNSAKAIPPQKVNSFAELLGTMTSSSTSLRSQSQRFECNHTPYHSGSTPLQQNHILHGNGSVSSSNLPQMTNFGSSLPSHPNFPSRLGLESSGASTLQANGSNEFTQTTLGTSIPTLAKEKSTPSQKTPKRKKHQPKVVKEAEPKKTPVKPDAAQDTPDGKQREKRKYVRRKGVETPKTPCTADAAKEVEACNSEPAETTCKRSLNFDTENGSSNNKSRGRDFDGQPKEKRKSVRRKGVETAETPCTDTAKEGGVCDVEPAAKTPRRSLNFDAESRDFDCQALNKSNHSVSTQSSISIAAVPSCNQAGCTQGNEVLQSPTSVPAKSPIEQKPPHAVLSVENVHQNQTSTSTGFGKKVKGGKKLKISKKEENALVPYIGERAIVEHKEKKHVSRPKVELDPESKRVWKLLMEGNGNAQEVDNEKQRWWGEERKNLVGRADTFIRRMHQVQGDRRFSKWKGSVVDSVVGVFLTQNVTDHLSSSAFMNLAAAFPLKSGGDKPECSRNGEQNQVRVTFPDEDIISPQSPSESFAYQDLEDIGSSSDSDSDSETEEQIMGSNFSSNHFPDTVSEQAQRAVESPQRQFPATTSSYPESSSYGQYAGVTSDKNVNSHPFTSDCPSPDIPPAGSWLSMLMDPEISLDECMSYFGSVDIGATTETSYTAEQTERPDSQSSLKHHGAVNNHSGEQSSYSDMAQGINWQSYINMQNERMSLEGLTRPFEAFGTEPYTGLDFDNQAYNVEHPRQSEHANPKPNETKPTDFSDGQQSKIDNATQTGKKRKAKKEKVEPTPFNWDTLRVEVESKKGPRGTNVYALDSMDYEALRNADVSKVSEAIKERGMNRMLAERIQAFLNRLVHDHGKIDLEWLRDVQPEKAKDYLLSIQGLGLKSVECVRLLTLHQLAFPVDTNVARIAVRLGWVPLQPLPESLQLHLLEKYPVLASIQKYLWPRLCKLDQKTLYELHYQLITFGKVFCTKLDPNCNACPMRAECRHFASAFASARLALPKPEEKCIVRSANQTTPKKFSGEPIEPMPLLQSSFDCERERETGFGRNDEPIIEEPPTPEPPTEVLERDIEDAFYEDQDEIPVIKLNLQEFTSNLQNFMQDSMDMSKALVALSPEHASIPMPKLKHASRLRTEHRVYVLPDEHPLLIGMDRREADDPSPYLLAIWSAGETADSVQPPESCSSLDGRPCNLATCFSCNSTREATAQTVRGTILIPCRTAMRGSFPLNGTYFQVNEFLADHETSVNPLEVPRSWLWPLERRTIFFGTSVSTIFKGLSVEDIQVAFRRAFVCVRGFDRESRTPRPLRARLHLPPSKSVKKNEGSAGEHQ